MKDIAATGLDDFRALRERGLPYIDRSLLVQGLLDHGGKAILLPRPKGDGKSVDLSMLRCFFEKREEDLSGLFVDLAIAQAGDRYVDEFQRYPVIHLRLGGIAGATWEHAWVAVQERIEHVFDEHVYLLDSPELSEDEVRDYRAVLAGVAPRARYETALLDLCRHLRIHHREKVLVLIDDHDEPARAGLVGGCVEEILGFYRVFIDEGLKGNPHLFKAVLSGSALEGGESDVSRLEEVAGGTPGEGD
jgi:predicted AAA-ATPase